MLRWASLRHLELLLAVRAVEAFGIAGKDGVRAVIMGSLAS